MAISVVCGGCRSQYSVPESAAGKRAKCQKCGQVMQVPLDEPELVPIDDVPVLEPVEDEPQLAPLVSPVADLSSVLSDIPSLPSKLNTTYVAPTTPGVLTGTTVFLSILSGIITFLVSVVAGVLLLCTLSPYLSLTMLVLGLAATAGSVVLGMKQRLGLAWTVCGIYCCLSCLAIAKTGYDIASGVTSAAAEAVEREEARSTAENNSASSEPSTPTMPTEKPSEPAAEKSEPVKTALVTNNDLSSDSPPWKAAVYRPKLTDWSLIADPLPAWATIDDGKPLSITFEGSPISPVYFPATPGRMIGVNARVDRQPVLQVWDLHLRKQVGQLPGQNTFVQGEYIISPDGQNIAGMVHNSGGPQPNVNGQAASGSGLQLEVWSLADAQ
ncbi:MAG TPA: hypothetical protein VL096_02195, partial [Pirellulaceae bacterium]|nr:hypothetical protein [Pirellulaceae bacterium]